MYLVMCVCVRWLLLNKYMSSKKEKVHVNVPINHEQSTDEMFSSEGKLLKTSVCWFVKQFQFWWWKLSFENICWLFVARCLWIVGGKVIYMYIYQGTTEGKLTLSVWCIVWIISLAVYTCLCRGTRKEVYLNPQLICNNKFDIRSKV